MKPAEALRAYLEQVDAEPDVLRASLLVARHARPELNEEDYLGIVADWAATLRTRIPPDAGTKEKLVRLNHFLFQELGFRGADDDYYNASNSLMDEVIARRRGIPITLSVLYMKLAHSIDLPLEGVSFPGHFLVKLNLGDSLIVLDPYHQGISLGEEELLNLLRRHRLDASEELIPLLLTTANSRDIMVRLLRNLKYIYRQQRKQTLALEVYNMILAIDPKLHEERRERGLLLRELECNHAALEDLSAYLEAQPEDLDDDEEQKIRKLVLDLRRELRPLH